MLVYRAKITLTGPGLTSELHFTVPLDRLVPRLEAEIATVRRLNALVPSITFEAHAVEAPFLGPEEPYDA